MTYLNLLLAVTLGIGTPTQCLGDFALNLNTIIYLGHIQCSTLNGKILQRGGTPWPPNYTPVIEIRSTKGEKLIQAAVKEDGGFEVKKGIKPGKYCIQIGLHGWVGFDGWLTIKEEFGAVTKNLQMAPE